MSKDTTAKIIRQIFGIDYLKSLEDDEDVHGRDSPTNALLWQMYRKHRLPQ